MRRRKPVKRYRIIYRASRRTKSGRIIYAASYGKRAFRIKIPC